MRFISVLNSAIRQIVCGVSRKTADRELPRKSRDTPDSGARTGTPAEAGANALSMSVALENNINRSPMHVVKPIHLAALMVDIVASNVLVRRCIHPQHAVAWRRFSYDEFIQTGQIKPGEFVSWRDLREWACKRSQRYVCALPRASRRFAVPEQIK